MNLSEKIVNTSQIFEGDIIKINKNEVLLPNGKTSTREIVKSKNAVCIAVLTEDNQIIFEKQFRCPFNNVVLELPAGKMEDSDETPLNAAIRELKEETGIIATDYKFLGEFYSTPGFCTEIIYMYACKLSKIEGTKLDEDEFRDIIKIPIQKAIDMILNNEIKDGKTQALILKLNTMINNG